MKTLLPASDFSSTPITYTNQVKPYSAYSHCPFGHAAGGSLKTSFTGRMTEDHSGYYLLGNGQRAYLPTLARFIQPDKYSPFQKGGLNSYSYACGNPTKFHDRSGHAPQIIQLLSSILDENAKLLRAGRGDIFNPTVYANGVQTFVTAGKTGNTLNIAAHGGLSQGNPYIRIHGKKSSAEDLFLMLKEKQVNFHRYSSVRTIICHSGTTPKSGSAIGQEVSDLMRLPTKSYIGKVYSIEVNPRDMESISPELRQRFPRYSPREKIIMVKKRYPEHGLINIAYQPVLFHPRS